MALSSPLPPATARRFDVWNSFLFFDIMSGKEIVYAPPPADQAPSWAVELHQFMANTISDVREFYKDYRGRDRAVKDCCSDVIRAHYNLLASTMKYLSLEDIPAITNVEQFRQAMIRACDRFALCLWAQIVRISPNVEQHSEKIEKLLSAVKQRHPELQIPPEIYLQTRPSPGRVDFGSDQRPSQELYENLEALSKALSPTSDSLSTCAAPPYSRSPPEDCMDLPPNFTGKNTDRFDIWWFRVESYICVFQACFPKDQIRIAWVACLLKDVAMDWYQIRKRGFEKYGLQDNWLAFMEALKDRFYDPVQIARLKNSNNEALGSTRSDPTQLHPERQRRRSRPGRSRRQHRAARRRQEQYS
ncbi:hypothetical protein SEPCBS119000_005610 [Sporothrix epigloea]|uniref:Retrotransposon gag domain-containing protein n=1 Tax=Sporothrix epigloea TaxID=1892477 RepID=A0ABP0DYI3_9PEZI